VAVGVISGKPESLLAGATTAGSIGVVPASPTPTVDWTIAKQKAQGKYLTKADVAGLPQVALSTPRLVGDSGRVRTPEQEAMFKGIGLVVDDKTVLEKMKGWINAGLLRYINEEATARVAPVASGLTPGQSGSLPAGTTTAGAVSGYLPRGTPTANWSLAKQKAQGKYLTKADVAGLPHAYPPSAACASPAPHPPRRWCR
jgi:hypothetical protein